MRENSPQDYHLHDGHHFFFNIVTSLDNHNLSNHQQLQLFDQQLVQTNNKENMKAMHYWSFVRGIHR